MILSHKNHSSNHQILQVALQAAEQQLHIYFIDLHTYLHEPRTMVCRPNQHQLQLLLGRDSLNGQQQADSGSLRAFDWCN